APPPASPPACRLRRGASRSPTSGCYLSAARPAPSAAGRARPASTRAPCPGGDPLRNGGDAAERPAPTVLGAGERLAPGLFGPVGRRAALVLSALPVIDPRPGDGGRSLAHVDRQAYGCVPASGHRGLPSTRNLYEESLS